MYEILKVKTGSYTIHMVVNAEQVSDVISHLESRSRSDEYRFDLEAIIEDVMANYDCSIVDVHYVQLW